MTTPRTSSTLLLLGLGLAALLVGTLFGWDAGLVEAIVRPPPLVRAMLVGASVVLAGALLVAALGRLGAGRQAGPAPAPVDAAPAPADPASGPLDPASSPADPASAAAEPDLPTMVRGVRLVFLALAALAAAAGWLLGHPLPLVVALVIAGVDVIETSFLLLVVSRRRG